MRLQVLDRTQLKTYLPRWLRRSSPTFSRQYERKNCALAGQMRLIESDVLLPGSLLELSQGGCSFRPATMFLLDRDGDSVEISTDYFTLNGLIRATRPEAYGVQFQKELDRAVVQDITARYPRPEAGEAWLPRR